MAKETNSTLKEMLDLAIENQRRQLLLSRTNLAYARLRKNKKAWKRFRNELRQLDATLSDGLYRAPTHAAARYGSLISILPAGGSKPAAGQFLLSRSMPLMPARQTWWWSCQSPQRCAISLSMCSSLKATE